MAHSHTGGKPLPTPLKILRSTSKDAERLRKRQIATPGALSKPPDWFSDQQKAAWAYAIKNAPREVLKRIDKAVLSAFIISEDIHRQATEAMQQTTLLVKSPKQQLPLQNPYLPIVNRQFQLMLRAASELGFTPVSRARIEGANIPTATVSDWDEVAAG